MLSTAVERPPLDDELKSLIEDFDHHSDTYVRRFRDAYAYIHALPTPVLRSERYGGFWVFCGYKTLIEMQRRNDVFSNKEMTIPRTGTPPLIPAFEDPPNHSEYRKVLAWSFSPAAVAQREDMLRALADDIFDKLSDKDEFDIVHDIAEPLIGKFTMSFLGLDPEEYAVYAEPFHNTTFDVGTAEEQAAQFHEVILRVKSHIAETKKRPSGVIGTLLQADFQGRKLTDAEIEAMTLNILAGGLGTTQAFVGSVAVFLGRHTEHRQILIDDPHLIETTGIDELLRFFGPVQTMAKLAVDDITLDGVAIKAGDMVLMAYGAANIDPRVFEEPMTVDLRRKRDANSIMTFGIGPHRCLGSYVARAVTKISLRRLLEVAPHYNLIEERLQPARSFAQIMGYERVAVCR